MLTEPQTRSLPMSSVVSKPKFIEICEVCPPTSTPVFTWTLDITDDYPHVSMDSEFPNIILCHVGSFKMISNYQYRALKFDVNLLNPVQLSLTFSTQICLSILFLSLILSMISIPPTPISSTSSLSWERIGV